MSKVRYRVATVADHEELVKLAKTSKYTKDFSNAVMFSSEAAYAKGWITCAEVDGRLVGLACVRHKTRSPETKLYFLVVDEGYRKRGVAKELLDFVMGGGPHDLMRLMVMKDNDALKFYERLGFEVRCEVSGGAAYEMERTW